MKTPLYCGRKGNQVSLLLIAVFALIVLAARTGDRLLSGDSDIANVTGPDGRPMAGARVRAAFKWLIQMIRAARPSGRAPRSTLTALACVSYCPARSRRAPDADRACLRRGHPSAPPQALARASRDRAGPPSRRRAGRLHRASPAR